MSALTALRKIPPLPMIMGVLSAREVGVDHVGESRKGLGGVGELSCEPLLEEAVQLDDLVLAGLSHVGSSLVVRRQVLHHPDARDTPRVWCGATRALACSR